MRRIAGVVAVFVLCSPLLAACGSEQSVPSPPPVADASPPVPVETAEPDAGGPPPTPGMTLPPPGDPCKEPKAGVVVLDRDGNRRWTVELPHKGEAPAAAPVAHGGVVLTNQAGELRAFDAASGRERWRVQVGRLVYGEWVIAGVVVAVVDQVGDDAVIVGHDLVSGKRLWRFDVEGHGLFGEQHPTADGGLVVVEHDGSLAVIDARTGRRRWSVPGEESGSVAVAGDTVVRGLGSRLVAYRLADGRERWSVDAGGEVMPSVVGGVVVVKSGVLPNPAPVAGYALEDGRRLWTASFGFDYGTSALTSAGLLFDEGPSGGSQRLLLLDPASGKARWEVPAQVFVDAPVVAGDFLVEGEGVPGPDGGGGSKLVIRRVADGGVKETVPGVSYSDHGVAAGRRAYLPVSVTDGQGFTHALVLVEDGVVRNRHPLERMAHRPPAVLDDGGVAIQIADAMCATTLAGG